MALQPGCDRYCYDFIGYNITRHTDCGAYQCLASWSVEKIDLDGHMSKTEIDDLEPLLSDGGIPLTGDWTFTPDVSLYPFPARNKTHAAFQGIVKCTRQ